MNRRLGAGREARFHTFEHGGTLRGARFVLRRDADDAVALAVEHLVSHGFTARGDDIDARLREMGSPWLAKAAEIGDATSSWTKGVIADLIENTPLMLFSRVQRGISPTLVMVAARALPEATTELVLFPHPSDAGHPEGWAGAAARVRAAVGAIVEATTAEGTLVSHEVLKGIRNDGSPASQQMVRELVGWR
jgi:hypothetical protein